jgi:hypothetical protein
MAAVVAVDVRKMGSADISSYKHWQISPVALGKQKMQH